IPAVHVAVDEATIRRGEAVIAEGVAGAIDLELAAYDPQEIRGRALLRGLSGELRGDAQLPGLAWLADVGVEVPATIRGGAGSLSAAVGLRQGVLTPGSRARYEAAKIELRRDREGDAEG